MPRCFWLLLAVFLAAAPATAEDAPQDTPRHMRVLLPADPIVLGVGTLGLIIPEALKGKLAPSPCHVCERNADGSVSVNGFDRGVRSGLVGLFGVSPPAWDLTSTIMVGGVLPALSIVEEILIANHRQLNWDIARDVGVMGEAILVAEAVDELAKYTVGRQRPFVAYNSPYSTQLHVANDDNLSFFSGHSTAALSMTVAMSRIIQIRSGSKLGYYTLVPLGILTSLMRVAADKHWATDVLVGMAVGTASGLVIPWLHE